MIRVAVRTLTLNVFRGRAPGTPARRNSHAATDALVS